MKQYELTVLIHPDLEMNLTPALDKISKLIESQNGKIVKETNEGKKRLAYSINKQDYAVYYFYKLQQRFLPPLTLPTKFYVISWSLSTNARLNSKLSVKLVQRRLKILKNQQNK